MEYDKYKKLPSIELQGLAIDYSELYERAMDDYIYALKNNCPHAVSASFILPSMIERGLAIALQNRLLYKMLAELCGKIKCQKLLKPFDWEEESCVRFFLTLNESLIFPASEDQIMGKMYDLFVREKILDDTADNRMILVGKDKRMNRTLGSMIRSVFAEKEISAEYLELLKDMFGRKKLNIRNCIMHGLGESYDYLSIAIVAVMFQVLWDIEDGSIWG